MTGSDHQPTPDATPAPGAHAPGDAGAPPDERLSRAFDRAARLGIDVEPDSWPGADAPGSGDAAVGEGAVSERESAAVRAFTALHLDGDAGPTTGPIPVVHTGQTPVVGPTTGPNPVVDPIGHTGPNPVVDPTTGPNPVVDTGAHPVAEPIGSPPGAGAPGPNHRDGTGTSPAPDVAADGQEATTALRPDAVLHGRRLSGHRLDGWDGAADRSATRATGGPPTDVAGATAPDGGGAYGATTRSRRAAGAGAPPRSGETARPSGHDTPDPAGATAGGTTAGGATAGGAGVAAPEAATLSRDQYLVDLAALTIATGAFVAPLRWTALVAAGSLVAATAQSVRDRGAQGLVRRAGRRILGWLRPRSLLWFAIGAVRTALLAVVLPAVVCGAWWMATEGRDGTIVAVRMGVWAHGPRTAAALVCYMLVAGVGEARQRRTARLRGVTGGMSPGAVAAAALALATVGALVVTVVPRTDTGGPAAADGLGWVPGRLRDNVDRVRDDLVVAELHATAGCLSDWQGLEWRSTYTSGNPAGDADVAGLSTDGPPPSADDVATAAAAAHNQLAPWVETIEVATPGGVVVFDRSDLPSGRPVVDIDTLAAATPWGADEALTADVLLYRPAALACAAAPLP